MLPNIVIPAFIALVFKVVLLGYSVRSRSKNTTTRLFLALLSVLALHNLSEVLALNHFVQYGVTPRMALYGFAYVALLIPAIALILHVSLRLSLDLNPDDAAARFQPLLYLPGIVLLCLLVFTDQLVIGFQPFKNTVLRVPGPLYFLFETYVSVYLLAAIANLIYGARASRSYTLRRVRNRLWLLALLPTGLLLVYLIIANHFGWAKLTSTIYMPITLTFFLIVTTYTTHQYRLFEIEFFIPWSKLRERKTIFYKRIQATVAELADLRSANDALARVSDLLRCPAALIGGPRPVLAHAGDGSLEMAQFPHDELGKIDHIVVANEIAEAMPEMHQLMKRFGVAVVVPFHPHSKTAASWMLLGDSFNDSVYSPLDFKNVERLFDSLGEFFLDKIAFLRAELDATQKQARNTEGRLEEARKELAKAREENMLLRDYNFRLMRENNTVRKALDSRIASTQPGPTLTLVPKSSLESGKPLDEQVAELEAHLIRQALKRCGGNKSEAAQLLGLRANTLHYKIKRYGLEDHNEEDK